MRRVLESGPWNSRGRAERHVELDTLGVDREELLVVQRDLRIQAGGERVHCLQLELVRVPRDLADRVHPFVRVDRDRREERVRQVADGAAPDVVLDTDDRLGDAVTLQLEEQHLDGVAHLLGLPCRHVLEHVAGGELEAALARRGVVAALAYERVELVHVLARLREADRGVDHPRSLRVRVRAHESSLKTRWAFSRRNFGQT